MADLIEYLKGRECQGFEPRPIYSRDGDFLTYFFKDVDFHGRRVDDLLTLYFSEEGEELVGCKIKGVRRILSTLGEFGAVGLAVEQHEQTLTLGLLFLGGLAVGDPEHREEYEEMGRRTKNVPLDAREFAFC